MRRFLILCFSFVSMMIALPSFADAGQADWDDVMEVYLTRSESSDVFDEAHLEIQHSREDEAWYDAEVEKIIRQMKLREYDEYEQLKRVHDMIILRSFYEVGVYDPIEMLKNGGGVCQAYALLYKKFLDELGFHCQYVTGDTRRGGHAWNMVWLDGAWYNVDVTWDDPLVYDSDHNIVPAENRVNYGNFLISDAALYEREKDPQFERCTSTKFQGIFMNCVEWEPDEKEILLNGLDLPLYEPRLISWLGDTLEIPADHEFQIRLNRSFERDEIERIFLVGREKILAQEISYETREGAIRLMPPFPLPQNVPLKVVVSLKNGTYFGREFQVIPEETEPDEWHFGHLGPNKSNFFTSQRFLTDNGKMIFFRFPEECG